MLQFYSFDARVIDWKIQINTGAKQYEETGLHHFFCWQIAAKRNELVEMLGCGFAALQPYQAAVYPLRGELFLQRILVQSR
jgi:hypothetical protein